MEVHKSLGPGLLEQCYHNALFYELKAADITVKYNVPYKVMHRGQVVGEYFADLVAADKVVIEVKAVNKLGNAHYAQVLNYLHISGCKVGFLVNFQGISLEWKRVVVNGSG